MYSNGAPWIHGWTPKDTLEAPIGYYSDEVKSVLDSNSNHNMRTLMQRPKTERLCFGQRSDYQCEASHVPDDYWFYSFQQHPATNAYDIQDYSYGNAAWVRYCPTNIGSPGSHPGLVVKRLKANNEQVNTNIGGYQGDKIYDWYIKPRMRIDSNFAHNNRTTVVCRIDVYDYYGDTQDTNRILSIDILAGYCGDQTENYNGKYLEECNFQSFRKPSYNSPSVHQ